MPASTLPHLIHTAPAVTGAGCIWPTLTVAESFARSLFTPACWGSQQLTVGTGLLACMCSLFLESLVWP